MLNLYPQNDHTLSNVMAVHNGFLMTNNPSLAIAHLKCMVKFRKSGPAHVRILQCMLPFAKQTRIS